MMRVAFVILALFSPFLFPYPLTLLLSFGAALIFSPLALLIGVLTDALYFVPGVLPYGSIWGLVLTILSFPVRDFLKTRIIQS